MKWDCDMSIFKAVVVTYKIIRNVKEYRRHVLAPVSILRNPDKRKKLIYKVHP